MAASTTPEPFLTDRQERHAELSRRSLPRVAADGLLTTCPQPHSKARVSDDLPNRLRPRRHIEREQLGALARDLAEGRDIACNHGTAPRHRLEGCEPEALVPRGKEQCKRAAVELIHLGVARTDHHADRVAPGTGGDR